MSTHQWHGVFGASPQTPSIDEMKQLISMYIFSSKGVRINVQLREDQMQGDLDKLEKAYHIAYHQLTHGQHNSNR